MAKNFFVSDAQIVGVACEVKGNELVAVALFEGDALNNPSGAGKWRKGKVTLDMQQMSDMIGGADRYLAGRPIVREGLSYYFALQFDIALSHKELQELTNRIAANAQALADPVPELARVFKSAKEQITVGMTIQFRGAERRAKWVRVKGQAAEEFPQSILLSEAGVQALCRAFGWRAEGPIHQGGSNYSIVFFPGEQVGDTISAKTDLQQSIEKQADYDSRMVRSWMMQDRTQGLEELIKPVA